MAPRAGTLTMHVFEYSGHTPQLEQPQDFDRVLLEWLQQASPRRKGIGE
jgi:pimeloyl-ACP methyl ester carboxylesterase